MFISELSPASIVVIVAGVISISALLISKISLLVRDKEDKKDEISPYECGFKNETFQDFKYVSENSFAISLYLVLELSISWLLICFAFDIADNEWFGKLFIKILSIVIFASIMIASKVIFNNRDA